MSKGRGLKSPRMFSIGQVNAITGIPKPTIRYWEKEFKDYLDPARTTGNQRIGGIDTKTVIPLPSHEFINPARTG